MKLQHIPKTHTKSTLQYQNTNIIHPSSNKSTLNHKSLSQIYKRKPTPAPIIKINGHQQQNNHIAPQINSFNNPPISINKLHPIKKVINEDIKNNNIQKQNKKWNKLFVHTMTKLSCDEGFEAIKQDEILRRNFPKAIVNILYGQNIHKYNPYIQGLDRLYQSFRGKVSRQMMERIKKLCYIGIARSHLKSQKYSQTPKYSRVNILIRTYMYEKMRSIVEEKAQNYQNVVYIGCNKDAISFSHRQFPKELGQICTRSYFQQTIERVNKIIEQQYISYKQLNTKQTVTDRWGQNLSYLLTLLFFVIFLSTNNIVFVYILGFFIVLSLVLYLYETRLTLSMLGSSKSIIPKIQSNIQNYLKTINTHNMEWKVGQDFYWLEIHYIKKIKKKPFKKHDL